MFEIEYYNGKKEIFKKDKIILNNFKSIYFTDGNNRYGFYCNGVFFINNYSFDLKINLNNFELIPFNLNTVYKDLTNNIDYVVYSIGYELINNDEQYKYYIIIDGDGILLKAEHLNKKNEKNEKTIVLK